MKIIAPKNRRYTPDKISFLQPNEIFVFGSNLAGAHRGGAARIARIKFGAIYGQGVGLQGQSYAIPTMQGGIDTIRPYVDEFISFAIGHKELTFFVTRIGCGIAGFKDDEIAPLFIDAMNVDNIILPKEFVLCCKIRDTEEVIWNSAPFIDQYCYLKANPPINYEAIRNMRISVFRNTVDFVKQGYYVTEKGKRISFDDGFEITKNTIFYENEFTTNSPTVKEHAIEVINEDCLEVGISLKEEGYNPAILNMASRRNPGGWVTKGSGAQEETLFRRTDLFRSLYQFAPYAGIYGIKKSEHQYPLDRNFGGIYTPNATIFRESEKNGYKLMEEPVKMSFISVAGMNRPDLTPWGNEIAYHHIEPIKNKIRTILRIGLQHNHDSLVLGAFGCGAFRNPAQHVAELFREVLFYEEEFLHKFRLIVFAIIDDHNAYRIGNPHGNFKPFAGAFLGEGRNYNEEWPDIYESTNIFKKRKQC